MSRSISKKSLTISILALILAFGALLAIFAGVGNKSDTDSVGSLSYSIGTIDTSTGKSLDSKLSLYTKDKYSVDGLEIKLADEPTVTDKVFFYDEDGEFVSATAEQAGDFSSELVPETAASFRILITPLEVDGEPVEVTFTNKGSYSRQLEVTYNK